MCFCFSSDVVVIHAMMNEFVVNMMIEHTIDGVPSCPLSIFSKMHCVIDLVELV